MIIAIGCDHSFFDKKNELINYLENKNYTVIDCGTNSSKPTHYGIYGHIVASLVAKNKADMGIIICGTGMGITNSAQKTKKIRAITSSNSLVIKKSRELYDTNILGLGGRIIGWNLLIDLVDTFIITKYNGKNISKINFINSFIKHDNYDNDIFDEIIKDWIDGKYTNGIKQNSIDLSACNLDNKNNK